LLEVGDARSAVDGGEAQCQVVGERGEQRLSVHDPPA
jgi:hypothetical protein